MRLYHFSEDPTIECFVPRSPLAHPEKEPMVWTIDAHYSPLYFFPRDCPRVCFWPQPSTVAEDLNCFYSGVTARMVAAIEWDWLERMRSTRLFRYRMPTETFVFLEDNACTSAVRQ